MVERHYIFPGVIEMNVQARRRLGVNIYLIDGGTEYALIDVGFLDELADVLELIRQMDFSLSACKMILATHADADHTQGLARAREVLKCKVAAHPKSVAPLEEGDEILTYARIDAQNIHIPMPRCKVDLTIDEGDVARRSATGRWRSGARPGHTAGQLAFRMGDLLFSGDNIFRDGCVGVIDAHHGSNLVDFIASLRRIRACDAEVPPPLARADLPQGRRPARRHDRPARIATPTWPTSAPAPSTGPCSTSGKTSWRPARCRSDAAKSDRRSSRTGFLAARIALSLLSAGDRPRGGRADARSPAESAAIRRAPGRHGDADDPEAGGGLRPGGLSDHVHGQRPGRRRRRRHGRWAAALNLLTNKSVQKELKLTDEQIEKATKAATEQREKMREKFKELQGLDQAERQEKMAET